MALQILYEVDCAGHKPEEVFANRLENAGNIGEEAKDFVRRMVEGTYESTDELDQLIASCAPEWPVEELAVLDRNILRLALWEITISKETPLKVAINEAVELAKRFSSDSAPRFINGVLGTLSRRE